MPPRRAPTINPAEAAYRRFLAQQKDGLQAWARKRAQLLDEVGMSADMEMIVVDLLEDLREEPAALVHAAADVHAGTHALLLRACLELKFVERFARQAIAIVLAREGGGLDGGLSIIQRPSLLSDCLDWLCVHVDVDELPLQFRPKLRRARPAPKLPGGATIDTWSGPPRTGQWSGGVVGSVANSSSSAAPVAIDEDDDEPPNPSTLPWTCSACTYKNAAGSTSCEMSAPRPPPPPLTAEQLAKRAEREEQREAEAASRAVVHGQLKRLASFDSCALDAVLLEASEGIEETALAGLVRETIERLAAASGNSELLIPSPTRLSKPSSKRLRRRRRRPSCHPRERILSPTLWLHTAHLAMG